MEAYIDDTGNMKSEVLTETTWNVFVKFLLTQLDCLTFVLSWGIAIYLAICRAVLFFLLDIFGIKEQQLAVKTSIDRGSSPRKDIVPDDDSPSPDDFPPQDDKSKTDSSQIQSFKKHDSGMGSFDSGSSDSLEHSAKEEDTAKKTSPLAAEPDKDLKSEDLAQKEAGDSSTSENVQQVV